MKIRTYENDNSISLTDKLTGTDADDVNKTKNYTFQKIKDFLIAEGLGGGVDVSAKVDKVTGKSLILDTEIARLLSMTAVFTTALKNTYDNYVNSIGACEVWSNKSTNVTTDGASDSKYPSVKSIKDYVDSNTVDTTFVNEPYLATMSIAYDSAQPNFEIGITGNLDLTITGTANGDSGLVNLYFSAAQVATLQGFTDLVITGASAMIPVYFIHDTDGIKWYQDKVGETASVAEEIFTIYHKKPIRNNGTITNVGNVVTGTGTTFNNPFSLVGSKLVKANGETAIIATVTNNTSLTTVEPFATNSTNSSYELRAKAIEAGVDGTINIYDRLESANRIQMSDDGNITMNGLVASRNNNITSNGQVFSHDQIELVGNNVASPTFSNRTIYTVATLPTPTAVGVYASVSNALSPAYLGIVTGGGAVVCPVYWNGTNWICH